MPEADPSALRGQPERAAAGADAGSVLAFDFGTRHLGVAVGETMLGLAHPLDTIEAGTDAVRFAAIGRLVAEWRPTRFVVGLPSHADGRAHELEPQVRRFARRLEGRYGRPVVFVDEHLTSAEAGSRLHEIGRGGRAHKSLTHPVAAQIILQNYFDEQAPA